MMYDIRPPPQQSECQAPHDGWTTALALSLCAGLIISYLPQHLRIVRAKTSEGFSPWYLLLGSTSAASGMLNLLIVQWPLFICCSQESIARCLESLLGFFQVTLGWLMFTIILVLFLIYFPAHLKYQRILPIEPTTGYGAITAPTPPTKLALTTTPEWRLAIILSAIVALHLGLLLLLSLGLLFFLPTQVPPHPLLSYLATFLGVSATILAVMQYAPQIYKTYKAGLVGALSIGTMVIQVPGSVLFVISLVLSPGTDWTSWLAFAVTGLMQAGLLVICLFWKRRQKRLGVDDFGNPIGSTSQDETAPLVSE